MLQASSFAAHSAEFVADGVSMARLHELAGEVRDSIEIVHTQEYASFLQHYFPAFSKLLSRSAPSPEGAAAPEAAQGEEEASGTGAAAGESKLRKTLLEVLNRLPHNELLRPYVQELMTLCLQVLQVDKEESALICLRIIFDLHKNFRPTLEEHVQPFLQFVCSLYEQVPLAVQDLIKAVDAAREADATAQQAQQAGGGAAAEQAAKEGGAAAAQQQASGGGDGLEGGLSGGGDAHQAVSSANTPSKRSFKVVIECPLIVMFLFQLYPKHIGQNVNVLLPLMVDTIALKGPPQPIPARLREAYADFKAAQVKTVSFLTYLLRSCADTLRPHKDRVSQGIVELLVTCPDSVATRKELLVATRHVLATEFRQGFHARIGTLLDEKVLVGSGRACYETLRPLGYSLLAELVHHVRLELSMVQLRRIVHLFSCNVHDPSLPTSVQTTCVRLMLNLVESIFTRRGDELSRAEGRALLGRILETFVSKLEALRPIAKRLIAEQKRREEEAKAAATKEDSEGAAVAKADKGKEGEGEKKRELLYLQTSVQAHAKEMHDCRQLLRTVVMGMKTLMWSVTNFNRLTDQQRQQQALNVGGTAGSGGASAAPMAPPPARGMSNDEVRVAVGVLKHGVPCLSLFTVADKDIFEHFAAMFTVLEAHNFRDIFSMHFDVLFEGMISNHALGTVPAALVAHPQTGRPFADVLGGYLASPKRLELLVEPESPAARLSLKLMSLLCSLVVSMPSDADRLARPHVAPLVSRLRRAIERGEPLRAFLDATRKLFRALAQTRSETMYAEFVPLLPHALEACLGLLDSPEGLEHRANLIEVCLNMPARMASLLPHLKGLVKPLLMAIEKDESVAWQPPSELTQLGLRVFESWVDKLAPDFFQEELGDDGSRLVAALWALVRPLPFQFGAKSLQLLGKLGGRSSRLIDESAGVQCKDFPEHGLRVLLTFAPDTPFLIPLDKVIAFAQRACLCNPEPRARTASLRVLHACCSATLGMRGKAPAAGELAEALLGAGSAADGQAATGAQAMQAAAAGGPRTRMQLLAEGQIMQQMLATCISAAALPDLNDTAVAFNSAIATHLAMLCARGHVKTQRTKEAEADTACAAAAEQPPPASAPKAAAGDDAATGKPAEPADGGSVLPPLPFAHAALRELDPLLILEAILQAAATRVSGHADAAAAAFLAFTRALTLLWKEAAARAEGDDEGAAAAAKRTLTNLTEAATAVTARLTHACYEDGWSRHTAGARLLDAMIACLIELDALSLAIGMPVVHALLHALGFCIGPASGVLVRMMSKTLSGVLASLFPVADEGGKKGGRKAKATQMDEDTTERCDEVCKLMAVKVFTPAVSAACRSACIDGLAHAANAKGVAPATLLEPFAKEQLPPLLAVPFGSRPHDEQAGLCDAITYCLEAESPLVAVDDALVPVLCDALLLADKEMSTPSSSPAKNSRGAPAKQLVSQATIKMMAAALAVDSLTMPMPNVPPPAAPPPAAEGQAPPAVPPPPADLRSKVVSVFFLCLIRGREAVAAPAKKGIQVALDRKNLPKELLQSSLRPILLNLATYRTLTLPLLSGLAELLSLLSAWFNVTLGEKLLEHLDRWMYLERLQAENTAWKPGEDAKVAAAIIELFHLLPDVAKVFLPRLVPLVDGLERALPAVDLPSEVCSILEAPLAKFLCKYPQDSVDYFLAKLDDPQQYRRLVSVASKPEGQAMRAELLASADKVLAVTFGDGLPSAPSAPASESAAKMGGGAKAGEGADSATDAGEAAPRGEDVGKDEATPMETDGGSGDKAAAPAAPTPRHSSRFEGIGLIAELVALEPRWLLDNPKLLEAVRAAWADPRRMERVAEEERLSDHEVHESERLLRCLVSCVREDRSNTRLLFQMLSALTVSSRVDYTFVRRLYSDDVAKHYTPEEKRAVLAEYLTIFKDRALPQAELVLGLKHIVLPVVESVTAEGLEVAEKVVDEEIINGIVSTLLDPPEEVSARYGESLRVELLQLATVLIREMPKALTAHRKELIKWGWNHLKRDDCSSKQWAFVNVCHFLEVYQAPEKIILQVFVALLRACQPEGRALVRKALDVLAPALPKRLSSGDHRFPIWIRYTKKILVEEGHSMPHLIHIWQLVVRHPDLFYSSRAQFVPQIINSLSRLGLPTNAPPENRRLALDLVALVVDWEIKRSKQHAEAAESGAKRERDGKGEEEGSPAAKKSKEEGGQAAAVKTEGAAPMDMDTDKAKAEEAAAAAKQQQQRRRSGDWFLNSAMEEMVVSFLTRMMFAAAEAKGKDREVTALYPHALAMFERVIKMWPTTQIRLNYLDKHFAHANVSSSVLLATLHVYGVALEVQGASFLVANNVQQIGNVLQRCFQLCDLQLHAPLAKVVAAVICAEPQPQQGLDTLQQKLEELTVLQLASGAEASQRQVQAQQQQLQLPPPPNEHCAGTPHAVCASQVLTVLMKEVHKRGLLPEIDPAAGAPPQPAPIVQRIGRLMASVLKLLHRYGKERLWRIKYNHEVASQQLGAPPSIAALDNVRKMLLLLCEQMPRLTQIIPQLKKGFLQALVLLIQTGEADPNALMAVLAVLREWLRIAPVGTQGALQTNEVVLFLQRLASIDRADTESHARREAHRHRDVAKMRAWKEQFLQLLEDLVCAPEPEVKAEEGVKTEEGAEDEVKGKGGAAAAAGAGPSKPGRLTVAADLRRDAFDKVERAFMIGLRANDPAVRRRFFARYHAAIDTQLYARLHAIVGEQEWEAVASTFWLTQAVRLLLAVLKKEEPITLAPNSAVVPGVCEAPLKPPSAAAAAGSRGGDGGDQPMAEVADDGGDEGAQAGGGAAPQAQKVGADIAETGVGGELGALFKGHSEFLASVGSLCVEDLIDPLEEIAHSDAQLSCSLWVIFFPIVWAALDKTNQVNVVKPMIALLSKQCHLQQAQQRPNVMQALLESISLSLPQPKVPSELIRFIGRTYQTWHVAIPMLESHVNLFPQDTRCFDALADLYRMLGEHDMIAGLWRKRCTAKETASGLALMQHGIFSKAQDVFSSSVMQVYGGNFPEAMKKAEICLWEDSWIQCAKQLNQWDQVAEFARQIDHNEMKLDSLWKLGEWQHLRENVFPVAQCEETPALKCVTARAALQAGSVEAGDQAVRQGVMFALHKWWALPPAGIQAHADLLFRFQQLVELQESARVLVEIGHASRNQNHPCTELKDILETWRLRLPNEWESLERWSEMVHWRSHMHNVVVNAFKDFHQINPPLHQLGFRDKAWSVNRLARIARKHGQPRVCVSVLNKMYGFTTMEVQEAFVKICEQAKAHIGPPLEHKQALNLLNTTNLEYFPTQHKAEIFRLRGEVLQGHGDLEGARQAFSTAVSIHKRLPKGWYSWARHCDYMATNAQVGGAAGETDWLGNAVAGYAQAAREGSAKQRAAVLRLVSLVALDACPEGQNKAATALAQYLDIIPAYVWLPWVPQLLVGLERSEAEAALCAKVLATLVASYPQACFYELRAFVLERRAGAASGGAEAQSSALRTAAECLEQLRSAQPSLCAELELLLGELGTRFLPRLEERLLSQLEAVLIKCHSCAAPSAGAVPPALGKALEATAEVLFSAEACARHAAFAARYKAPFEADFARAATFPGTLAALQGRLKRWRSTLRADVGARVPASLRLEEEAPALAAYRAREVDIPGQYLDPEGADVDVWRTQRLSHLSAAVGVVARQGAAHRRVGLVAQDGSVRRFKVETGAAAGARRGDERALQLLRAVNRLLRKEPECLRRRLALCLPVAVPLAAGVRLVEDVTDTVTLGEVYHLHCARYGRDADQPVTYFKEAVLAAGGGAAGAASGLEARKQAYSDIASKVISENLLNQFVYKTVINGTHLTIFKRHFTTQMALWSVLGAALHVGGRAPMRLEFSRKSGDIFHADFCAQLDATGGLCAPEAVPFRLTRNLQSFCTPFGVEGLLVASMAAGAKALVGDPRGQLREYLEIYFRDEVLNWDGKAAKQADWAPLDTAAVRTKAIALAAGVVGSLERCAPSAEAGEGGGAPPVHAGVSELVRAATHPDNIVRSLPTWLPWV